MPSVIEPTHRSIPNQTETNGCFETLRAYNSKLFRLNEHIERLEASAAFLGTRFPVSRAEIKNKLRSALKKSKLSSAVVRIALVPEVKGKASTNIVVQRLNLPSPKAYRFGIKVATVPARSFPVSALDAKAKYSARLGSILAVIDAKIRGADEPLFMGMDGLITENPASNVSLVRKNILYMPPAWLGALVGVTGDVLIEVARDVDLPVCIEPVTRHELYNADEVYLTSTIKEVLPVVKIDGRKIGSGRPGPWAVRLRKAFSNVIRKECSRVGGRSSETSVT